MKKAILPFAAVAAIALYGVWPSGDARSDAPNQAMNQGGNCTHDGKDHGLGETICVETKEYQCTTEGFAATGNDC